MERLDRRLERIEGKLDMLYRALEQRPTWARLTGVAALLVALATLSRLI